MTGFKGGIGAVGRSRACTLSCAFLAALVGAVRSAFTGSDDDGFGDFFFGHAFAANLAFFTDLLQTVFARISP